MSDKQNTLTDFGRASLVLDGDFAQFERLTREIEGLNLNSEKGLDRARQILTQIDTCGQRIGTGMQELARTLDEARQRTENAGQIVAERAQAVQLRQHEVETMFTRFNMLGQTVRQVTAALAEIRPAGGELSDEARSVLSASLPQFDEQIGLLVGEAKKLMDDAHNANLKVIEKNADSLRQSLQAARNRLQMFVGKHGH